MLDQNFSQIISDVVGFISDDLNDKLSSGLLSQKVSQLRRSIELTSSDLEQDKATVRRVRKSIKAAHKSGKAYQQCEGNLSNLLAELGDNALKCGASAAGQALNKFSAAYKEMNLLLGNLMQSLSNFLFSPLDTFVNAELKVDMRKGVDRALKDYEARTEKGRKERLQSARESRAGETSPAEATDSLDRDRRLLQLQLCEFLLTASDVKSKKQSSLVQYLSDYSTAQLTYFKECLGALQQLDGQMRGLAESLEAARSEQERERRSLVKLRDDLRSALSSERDNGGGSGGAHGAYSLHQSQGNRAHGTAKHGYLFKRSGSKVKKVWQKRRAAVINGSFLLYHADDTRAPVSLPLLTCQVRPASSDRRIHGRGAFSLVSNNRTYSFQCDSLAEAEHWVSVLSNAKSDAFQAAMGNSGDAASVGGASVASVVGSHSPGAGIGGAASLMTGEEEALRLVVLQEIRSMPGNQLCADCSTVDPEWISTNLGILICLECCGIHRDLGVHISRTQSLLMDDLRPAQLLASRCIGNSMFNDVFEAVLPDGVKPGSSAGWGRADLQQQMSERKAFIRAKYRERSYVCQTVASDATPEERASSLAQDLASAVRQRRMPLLLQVFAEGGDLMAQSAAQLSPRLTPLDGETQLHVLLRESAESGADNQQQLDEGGPTDADCLRRLAVLEFVLQNSPLASQRRRTRTNGESLTHYCVRYNRPESLRVCLRAPGMAAEAASARNCDGLTAIELCSKLGGREACAQILRAVESGSLSVLDNPGYLYSTVAGCHRPPLGSEASYPDLSLCSEDISCDIGGSGCGRTSPSCRSSGESSSGAVAVAASAAAAVASRQLVTPNKKSKAPIPPSLQSQPPPPPSTQPPPTPPAPPMSPVSVYRRQSREEGGVRVASAYDSVQIVIDAAMESFQFDVQETASSPVAISPAEPPLPTLPTPQPPQPPPLPPLPPKPKPKPAPLPKPAPVPMPKPRLSRASMPPMQLQSLVAEASAAAANASVAGAENSSSASIEDGQQANSSSF